MSNPDSFTACLIGGQGFVGGYASYRKTPGTGAEFGGGGAGPWGWVCQTESSRGHPNPKEAATN